MALVMAMLPSGGEMNAHSSDRTPNPLVHVLQVNSDCHSWSRQRAFTSDKNCTVAMPLHWPQMLIQLGGLLSSFVAAHLWLSEEDRALVLQWALKTKVCGSKCSTTRLEPQTHSNLSTGWNSPEQARSGHPSLRAQQLVRALPHLEC